MVGDSSSTDSTNNDPSGTEAFPPLQYKLSQDAPPSEPLPDQVDEVGVDLRVHLSAFRVKRQQAAIDDLRQTQIEREQIHDLRKSSTRNLFVLTIFWLSVIWLVIFLQGFSQWFFPYPAPAPDEKYLKFHLSDSVLIAFITSTTATVLGLYGIAAYWLYGKTKAAGEDEKKKSAQEKEKEKEKKDDAQD
ncbi:hypothetical protein PkoCFBP13504_22985 [Pseudomonas koreensis]|uniref:hypothetical protein n=1 Tax=Pseudomonas koreensis TaxID=198620 RepID=UPI0010BFCC18|nr:hypothetical protein [Pseudomonas koreensis]TKJ77787.1 hypothetical protein PkoCFBP13504_22985 [Pseudomonas koreensis]